MHNPQLEYTVTVHRVDDNPLRFKLRLTVDEMRNAGAAIESGLAANYLGVVLDGKLIVVPARRIAGHRDGSGPECIGRARHQGRRTRVGCNQQHRKAARDRQE